MTHGPRGGSVVKVGGSLLADARRLGTVLAGLAEGGDEPAVIVPGGGPFADAVRAAQGALGFGDPLAHRLALDAMGRMAEVFCELEPRLGIVRHLDAASAALSGGRVAVWNPVVLREGHPDIPESWDVTSDSLALWLATRLRAARCILVKSAPCPAGTDPAALVRLGLVDRAFPDFARRFDGDIVIRGPEDECTLRRPPREPSSHIPPHPEVPRSGLEGGLQGSRGRLEVSFEARLRLAPQDEGQGGSTAKHRHTARGDGAL